MNEALLLLTAFAAGVISFASPCCLPLIPGYLSYISTVSDSSVGVRPSRTAALGPALLFVAGFSVVFTLLGMTSGLIGSFLLRNLPLITQISGAGIVLLGLATLRVVKIPALNRERRPGLSRVNSGPRWAFPFGMAFAAGWTPCIGPVLATVLATAAVGQTATFGGALLLAYSAGLGVPFIALALGFGTARRSFAFLRRNTVIIERIGGVMLIVIGLAFITGAWNAIFVPLQKYFADWGWPPF